MTEVNNANIAIMVIEEGLVLDHILHRCMGYNSACRIKQYFSCYENSYMLVHCQKSTKCGAYLGLHRTSKYSQDKAQKCVLYKGVYTLWDK